MKKGLLSVVFLVVCCLIVSGCSFSTSSKQSSKSSSSPSRSSSGGGGESVSQTSTSLQEEVSTLAIIYVGSSGSSTDFQRELGQITKGHGIVDWENSAKVFSAIGKGLKRAGVSRDAIPTLPFLQGIVSSPYYRKIVDAYN